MAHNPQKRGRKPKELNKTALTEAVLEALPLTEVGLERAGQAPQATLQGCESQLVKSGLWKLLCWLIFCGISGRQIAHKLNVSEDSVQRYLSSAHFEHMYATQRDIMLGKVDDHVRERFQETLIWAVEEKIDLARNTTNRNLKNKILTELIEFGMQANKGQSGGISEQLKTLWERKRTKKTKDGTITEKVTVTTPGAPGATYDTAPSSGNPEFNGPSSEEDRGTGTS